MKKVGKGTVWTFELLVYYIDNALCVKCNGTTTIQDYSVNLDTHGIILQGRCPECEHQVARYIEEL